MAARFNPTHRCGHMGKSMPDTASARAYAAETVEPVDCWQCERMAHGMRAADMARMLGLPDMQGKSESQETFARDVRERIRQELEEAGSGNDPAADALLYGVTDAAWWLWKVDKQGATAADLLAWVQPIVQVVASH